jgi:hypothetical protein
MVDPNTAAQRLILAREEHFGPIVRGAFRKAGLPVEWGMAIARLESSFDPTRSVRTGADGAMGGAWGICQMTLQTAHDELNYKGDGPALLDPTLCSTLAAQLCVQHVKIYGSNFKDIAATYNGRFPYVKANARARAYADAACLFAAGYAGKFDDERDAIVA